MCNYTKIQGDSGEWEISQCVGSPGRLLALRSQLMPSCHVVIMDTGSGTQHAFAIKAFYKRNDSEGCA